MRKLPELPELEMDIITLSHHLGRIQSWGHITAVWGVRVAVCYWLLIFFSLGVLQIVKYMFITSFYICIFFFTFRILLKATENDMVTKYQNDSLALRSFIVKVRITILISLLSMITEH